MLSFSLFWFCWSGVIKISCFVRSAAGLNPVLLENSSNQELVEFNGGLELKTFNVWLLERRASEGKGRFHFPSDMHALPLLPGWRGRELPYRRDTAITPENHPDPRGLRVAGLHHTVWRHRHTGAVHVARGQIHHRSFLRWQQILYN